MLHTDCITRSSTVFHRVAHFYTAAHVMGRLSWMVSW